MIICEPFRFWTKQMRLVKVIDGLCFRLVLACVACTLSIAMRSHPVNAAMVDPSVSSPEAFSYSQEATEGCEGDLCSYYSFLFDPSANESSKDKESGKRKDLVGRIHLEFSFDPTQFKFDPRRSGPLCSFADGGTPCPPPNAKLGKALVRQDNTLPGIPPAGSILCFSQPNNETVVVDYTLPTPVDLSMDQNIFALAFDLITPIPQKVRVYATYFGEPGAHQFNLIAASCNGGAVGCVGVPPIFGVDFSMPNLQ